MFFLFFTFAAGDLGQTFDSNQTLGHYASNELAKALLFVGDLSYADHYPLHDNRRWDSWGRFVERVAAYQPWILTAGNHEIDTVPEIVSSKRYLQSQRKKERGTVLSWSEAKCRAHSNEELIDIDKVAAVVDIFLRLLLFQGICTNLERDI